MKRYAILATIVVTCPLLWAQPAAPVACQAQRVIASGDTLASISTFYFGSAAYGRAILLATNGRSGTAPFRYIGTPDALPAGATLCIPPLQEADVKRRRYDSYERSVHETVLQLNTEVSHSLVRVDTSRPVHVITWIRAAELNGYKQNGTWVTSAPKDIWITVVPEAKEFCQQFVRDHGPDIEQLTLRLEQRLGLPPGAGKTTFLELIVKDPSQITNLFRPCGDPSVSTNTCAAGPPSSTNAQYSTWFLNQYYGSFAQARPDQYPWTGLGYTFDWAQRSDGGFVRYGSSEFVIPKGAPIEVEGSTATADYCKPQ